MDSKKKDIGKSAIEFTEFIKKNKIPIVKVLFIDLESTITQVCQSVVESICALFSITTSTDKSTAVSYINEYNFDTLFIQKKNIRLANELLWICPSIRQYVCIDSDEIINIIEKRTELMHKKFWNYMAVNAKDDIESGAWFSSYTGEKFTYEEIHECIDNIHKKLSSHVDKSKLFLEIGCSSGLTMYSLAPYVKKYVALDLSDIIINRNQVKIENAGINNIQLYCLYAHEIETINESGFDVGLMNSVIQCFDGHIYFKRVLRMMINKMSDSGVIFIGDVIDAHKINDYLQSLEEYRYIHKNTACVDITCDLSFSKDFFYDLVFDFPEISEIEISSKYYTIENELTKYRYDVIVKLNKKTHNISKSLRSKHCYAYCI